MKMTALDVFSIKIITSHFISSATVTNFYLVMGASIRILQKSILQKTTGDRALSGADDAFPSVYKFQIPFLSQFSFTCVFLAVILFGLYVGSC